MRYIIGFELQRSGRRRRRRKKKKKKDRKIERKKKKEESFRYSRLNVVLYLDFVYFLVPIRISPMGNSGLFPQGKPVATESRYPTQTN